MDDKLVSNQDIADHNEAVERITQAELDDSACDDITEVIDDSLDMQNDMSPAAHEVTTEHDKEPEEELVTASLIELQGGERPQGNGSIANESEEELVRDCGQKEVASDSAPRFELFFSWSDGGRLKTELLNTMTKERSVYPDTFIKPNDESKSDFCTRVARMIESELAEPVFYHLPADKKDQDIVDEVAQLSTASNTEARNSVVITQNATNKSTQANGANSAAGTAALAAAKETSTSSGGNVSITIDKKLLVRIGIGIVAILAAVGIVIAVNNSNKEKAAAEEFNTYVTRLKSTELEMLSSGADAESVGNDVRRVWNSAIFDKDANQWDSDIKEYYSTDFNTSIELYYADNSSKITALKTAKENVAGSMRLLASPPDGCETAYATITDLYDEYNTLVGLAISPTGSLQTFSESFNAADTGFVNTMNKLDTQIPEQKQ